MRSFRPAFIVCSLFAVAACGDSGGSAAPADMAAPPVDESAPPDLRPSTPPPDLAGSAGSVACANDTTCSGGQACCTSQTDGGVAASCGAAAECAAAGSIPSSCDGTEDCSGGTPACCLDLALGSPLTGSASCQATCPGSATQKTQTMPAMLETRVCHWDGDCAGYMGSLLGIDLAFDHCCHHKAVPYIHFCAPAAALAQNAYDCP